MKTLKNAGAAKQTKTVRATVVSSAAKKKIELLRKSIAAARSIWKQAKENAVQAKHRRKLAKMLAKRAKKEVRMAKANLEELNASLAEARGTSTPWKAAAPRFTPKTARRVVPRKRVTRQAVRKQSSTPPAEPAAIPTVVDTTNPSSISPVDNAAGEPPAV